MLIKHSTILDFGKYETKTAEEILNIDWSYLLWVHDNVSGYTLSSILLKRVLALKEENEEDDDHHEYDYEEGIDHY